MELKTGRTSAKIKVYTFVLFIFIVLTLTSCKNEDYILMPEYQTTNLVIVTDNDPASYSMIKIMGKIRSLFPDLQITYLQCKQFSIYEGAFLLGTALASYPEGTVFAGIVEPGTGNKRLVYQIGSKRVFAPDNGLSTWALHNNPRTNCYFVENPAVLEGARPAELAYEEFYANAICSLIAGVAVQDFGTKCSLPDTFPVQEPQINGNTILGQILFTDNFGNCITNITETYMNNIPAGTLFTLKSDSVETTIKLGTTYSSVPEGENVCFINSSKFLELAINYGNFSERYNLSSGASFQISR